MIVIFRQLALSAIGFSFLCSVAQAFQPDALSSLRIRVVDLSGKPIESADVQADIIYLQNQDKKIQQTDRDGWAVIELDRHLQSIRISASHARHVALWRSWKDSDISSESLPTKEYVFQLPLRASVGGRIVDPDGKPIQNARVEVFLNSDAIPWSDPNVETTKFMAHGDEALTTDQEGRWRLTGFPKFEETMNNRIISIRIEHPRFISDGNDFNYHRLQDVSMKMLYDQSAVIVMKRGSVVTGLVTDPNGQPVSDASVFASRISDAGSLSFQGKTGEDGRYEMRGQAREELNVTVIASGWQWTSRTLQVVSNIHYVDFQLQIGKPLIIRVVDEVGKPLPKAGIRVHGWRDSSTLHNRSRWGLLASRIPLRTDAGGDWEWKDAPEGGVELEVAMDGYVSQQIDLTVRDEPHRVALQRKVPPVGSVIDSVTLKPIPTFNVIPAGLFHRQDTPNVHRERFVVGKNGSFTLQTSALSNPFYQLRIEAPGYRTAIGKVFAANDQYDENFELEPAPPFRGRVIDSDGKPVADASIIVGSPSEYQQLEPFAELMQSRIRSNDQGEFEMAARPEPATFLISHSLGFAERIIEPQDEQIDFPLQPWARINGVLVQNGKPIVNQTILCDGQFDDENVPSIRYRDSAHTDSNGRFEFSKVPPRRVGIWPIVPFRDSGSLTSGYFIPRQLSPGQSIELELGSHGAKIVGRVAFEGGEIESDKLVALRNLLVGYEPQFEPRSSAIHDIFQKEGWSDAFAFSIEGVAYYTSFLSYTFRLKSNGEFVIEGVVPGKYSLQLGADGEGGYAGVNGKRIIEIDAKYADGQQPPLDLGEIRILRNQLAKEGESFPTLEPKFANDESATLQPPSEKTTLIHAWASWSKWSVDKLPQLRDLRDQFPADRFELIGCNIEVDRREASQFVERQKIDWPQWYVGNDPTVTRKLGMSVFSYLVISRDGKLLLRTMQLDKAIDKIENEFANP